MAQRVVDNFVPLKRNEVEYKLDQLDRFPYCDRHTECVIGQWDGEQVHINKKMLKAFVALLFLFGRRISEVIMVEPSDIEIKKQEMLLSAHFRVVQRRYRRRDGDFRYSYTNWKTIPIDKQSATMTVWIQDYLETKYEKFFGGFSRSIIEKRKKVSTVHMWRMLKCVDPTWNARIFRKSLIRRQQNLNVRPCEMKKFFDMVY